MTDAEMEVLADKTSPLQQHRTNFMRSLPSEPAAPSRKRGRPEDAKRGRGGEGDGDDDEDEDEAPKRHVVPPLKKPKTSLSKSRCVFLNADPCNQPTDAGGHTLHMPLI